VEIFAVFYFMFFGLVLQLASHRRRSSQQILRMRRPATTSAKQRVRSVRKNTKGATSHASVAIDSFVEDSQDSLPQYYVRKPRGRAQIAASAICSDLPEHGVVAIRRGLDDEEDKYNMMESTEELELPCRAVSVNEMTACGELDADVTIVSESSHFVSDVNVSAAEQSTVVHNQPVVAAHSSIQTPPPLPPPVLSASDTNQTVSEERAASHGSAHRLPSLPTLQLDGQLDTPAATTVKRSSVIDKVGISSVCHCPQCCFCRKQLFEIVSG